MFGMDCGRSDDSFDDLDTSDEARGTSVGVMVCFEQFSDELVFLWQENLIDCDGTEVEDDGIDDGIASCVFVSWFPHPLWHQDQAPTVSGSSEKRFVQEKTTQQNNQVGAEEERRTKIARLARH